MLGRIAFLFLISFLPLNPALAIFFGDFQGAWVLEGCDREEFSWSPQLEFIRDDRGDTYFFREFNQNDPNRANANGVSTAIITGETATTTRTMIEPQQRIRIEAEEVANFRNHDRIRIDSTFIGYDGNSNKVSHTIAVTWLQLRDRKQRLEVVRDIFEILNTERQPFRWQCNYTRAITP